MKKIEIHGIASIERRSNSPWEERTSMISIGDTGAPPPRLTFVPERILRIEFDDITLNELYEEYNLPKGVLDSDEKQIEFLKNKGLNIFSENQAEQIADFVLKNYNDIDTLICQCHYGQSRSAGCAAAIFEYFFGNGIDIFANDRFSPNKLVYRKVISALERRDFLPK